LYSRKKMAQNYKEPIHVAISGAAGQIGYSLIPLVCSGLVFGFDRPIVLHLLEIEQVLKALNGIHMEIVDCAYPLVRGVICTSKVEEAFENCDYAILVGGFPRQKDMSRKDLSAKNGAIFKDMGEGLEKYAKKTTNVLVVANPANTNCLICSHYAPKIPKSNFVALTRLDMNRARSQIAKKVGTNVEDVKNVIIWGNHSDTQVPDVQFATLHQNNIVTPVSASVDEKWIADEFVPTVKLRGKAIIEARGMSSAMSAAHAIKDTIHDWIFGTPQGEFVSMGVWSDGQYNISKGIFYSFPCICRNGEYQIVQNLKINDKIGELLKLTEKELLEEKDILRQLKLIPENDETTA